MHHAHSAHGFVRGVARLTNSLPARKKPIMLNPATARFTFFILIAAATLFEVAGDVLFKKWSLEHRAVWLTLGLVIYFVGTAFWAYSLKYELLSRAISIFTVVNLVAIVLVGVLFFNEELSIINKLGIALGVLSVILVEW